MSRNDLILLLPLLIIGAAAVVVMLSIALRRRHRPVAVITLLALFFAFNTLIWIAPLAPRRVLPLFVIDRFALFYLGLLFAASFTVGLLAYHYFAKQPGARREEFYILLLLAVFGAAVPVISRHFASFFLGLEILSIALVVMAAYLPARERALEAGLKYLVLAATSTTFLLFGMALVYAETGTMELDDLVAVGAAGPRGLLFVTGLAMIVIGIGFKLAVVPFHVWTPDVYEGAPAPVTAFIASVSKGAVFALLLRYFMALDAHSHRPLMVILSLIAIASMLGGSLLALLQSNVKRLLAYSSIAHLGFLLVAFLAGGAASVEAATYYLVAYIVTILGAFGVVTVLSTPARDADAMEDYRGLFWRRPWIAAIFTAMLFSLAGIPLTAGFIGKFYILAAGVGAARWGLVFVLVAASAIGIFYYLRVVVAIYSPASPPEGGRAPILAPLLSVSGGFALAALLLLLIWFGVYPAPLIQIIRATVK